MDSADIHQNGCSTNRSPGLSTHKSQCQNTTNKTDESRDFSHCSGELDLEQRRAQFVEILRILKSSSVACRCSNAIDWTTANNEIAPLVPGNTCGAMCQRKHGISRCDESLTSSEYSLRFIPSPGFVTALCTVHQKQFRSHLACPICGVFIESGKATSCSTVLKSNANNPIVHAFHRSCVSSRQDLLGAVCPHCGNPLTNATDIIIHGIPKKDPMKEEALEMIVYPPPAKAIVIPRKSRFFSPLSDYMPFTCKNLRRNEDIRQMLELIDQLEKFGCDIPRTVRPVETIIRDDDVLPLALYLIQNSPCGSRKELSVALWQCVASNKLLFVHLLNSAQVPLDIPNEAEGVTPVMIAALKGHADLVRYLVDENCKFDREDRNGLNVLQHLLESTERQIIIFKLLENGVVRSSMLTFLLNDATVPVYIRSYARNFFVENINSWERFKKAAQENDESTMCSLILFNFDELTGNFERFLEVKSVCRNHQRLWRMVEAKWNAAQTEYVVCQDITFGKETMPVKVIGKREDPDPSTTFSYINRCVLPPGIKISLSVETYVRCNCGAHCEIGSCRCRQASCKTFDEHGLLSKDTRTRNQHKGIFECNALCQCGPECGNRVVQKGITCPFQIRRTSGCGWGLFTDAFIPEGKFLVEYCGVIISDQEADNRKHQGHSYLFQLESGEREFNGKFCMDAGPKGNIARFLNHSCTPNVAPFWFYSDIQDMRFPRVVFFATENIPAGEQLCFDYGKSFWHREHSDFTCECGSYACYYRKPEKERLAPPSTSSSKKSSK